MSASSVVGPNKYLLTVMPDFQETKSIIFVMCASTVAGHNGCTGTFFNTCWDIIQNNIKDFIQTFFQGKSLTKFYTHTCLVLIPKIDSPNSFLIFNLSV